MYFDGMSTPPPAVHVPSDAPQGTPVEIAKNLNSMECVQNVKQGPTQALWNMSDNTFPFLYHDWCTDASVFLVHVTSKLGSYWKVSLIDMMAFDCSINDAQFLSTWNRHDFMSGTLDHEFSPTFHLTSVSSEKHWCEQHYITLPYVLCGAGLV